MESLFVDILLTVLAIFVGSVVLVTAGFGIAIGSSPIMLLTVDPQSTVIVINTVSLLIFVLMIHRTCSLLVFVKSQKNFLLLFT